MNHATETKKLNNQGFSLVELIIVVAIMAVLVGVLAPQYLRYVENSRYQTDVTMADSIRNAIKVALATDEQIYADAEDVTITLSDADLTSIGWTSLNDELIEVIGNGTAYPDTALTSKTCIATPITITITETGDVSMTYPEEANSTTTITK